MSEFGTVLEHIHGGRIILGDDGDIFFMSSAFNPLTSLQLNTIIVKMAKYEESNV